MKEEAIEKLNETLETKTGVDFKSYRNEELIETVGGLQAHGVVRHWLLPSQMRVITKMVVSIQMIMIVSD